MGERSIGGSVGSTGGLVGVTVFGVLADTELVGFSCAFLFGAERATTRLSAKSVISKIILFAEYQCRIFDLMVFQATAKNSILLPNQTRQSHALRVMGLHYV